jgi:hypothetical protein
MRNAAAHKTYQGQRPLPPFRVHLLALTMSRRSDLVNTPFRLFAFGMCLRSSCSAGRAENIAFLIVLAIPSVENGTGIAIDAHVIAKDQSCEMLGTDPTIRS